jgi:hypothetical protein
MHRLKLLLTSAAAVAALSSALVAPASAAGTAARSVHSFAVLANTAVSPSGGMMGSPGDWISVTGAGGFDVSRRTVDAVGTFVHHSAAGAVECEGTWRATDFTSFVGFGANPRGRLGGVLSIVVTHFCQTMGMTMTGIPMTVTSTVNAPAGYVAGTTVADFTQPTGGIVAIW